MNKEVFDKVSACKSVDEILELAKTNGIEISKEKAEEIFNTTHNEGELNDNELDNVAGGTCGGERSEYEKVYWATKEEVQYIARVGEEVQVFQGADSSYTLTCCVSEVFAQNNENGYYDMYRLTSGGQYYKTYDRTWIQK